MTYKIIQGWELALSLYCFSLLALFKKSAKSNSIHMIGGFALFKSVSLQIRSFHHAFPFSYLKQKSKLLLIAFLALCKRGNRSRCSFKNSEESNSLLSLFTKRVKKTSDSHKKPKSEFPTLKKSCQNKDILKIKKYYLF